MTKNIYLMLGYPGSGKSTFAKQLAQQTQTVRLNSDELRQCMFSKSEDIQNIRNNPLVFGALDYAMEAIIKAGQSVIYDANNNRLRDRRKAHLLAKEQDANVIIIWVQVSKAEAKKREAKRANSPNYLAIPPERHDALMAALTPPTENETTIKINGRQLFSEQYASFQNQLETLGLS